MKIRINEDTIGEFIDSLSLKQKRVLIWMVRAHGRQKRKYTKEPYWNHPIAVAYIASLFERDKAGVIEVALLHDVLEDTEESAYEILIMLMASGYSVFQSEYILEGVRSLTDVYTHEKFPRKKRFERKIREAYRLGRVRENWQTVKLADLYHNTKSIVKHDPKFAVTYLKEKEFMLKQMKGNAELWLYVWRRMRKSQNKLGI